MRPVISAGDLGIALHQPAARGHSVGLVHELARGELREVPEQGLAEQARVQRGHAVDLVAANDGQMCHAHLRLAPLLDQAHAPHAILVVGERAAYLLEKARVDLVDDLEMPRQEPLQKPHRPTLERLGHERVIGVSEALPRHLPGLVPAQPVAVHHQAHELCHRQGRVGVVELKDRGAMEIAQVLVTREVTSDGVLKRGGDQEVLLLESKLLARELSIVRVEHARDGLGRGLVLDRSDVVALIEIQMSKARVALADQRRSVLTTPFR